MELKKNFKNIIIRNLILAILLVVVLVFGISWWLNVYTRHGESVEIPKVKDMKLEAAKPLFEASGLSYQVIDSTYNKTVRPGTIIETIPPVGSRVKRGRTIYIRLNSYSAGMISIPDVRDVSQRQATAMLKALGFENINTRWVAGPYRDLVIGLEYQGRALQIKDKLPANAALTLLVSQGSNTDDSVDPGAYHTPAQTGSTNDDSDTPLDF